MKKLKKGLAVVLSAAMLAGMMPGMGSMKVSAVENGSGTDSISSVKLSAISGTKGAGDAEDYGMLIDGKYSSTDKEDYSKWCVKDFSGAYIIFSASEAGYVTGYSITTGNNNVLKAKGLGAKASVKK